MQAVLLSERDHDRVMRRAVEFSYDVVVITRSNVLDPPGPEIVYVNPAFESRTGYSAAEALGRNPRFLQGELTDPQECQRIRQALERGAKVSARLVNYRRDGSPHLVELHIAPVMNGEGSITHFVSIQREVGCDFAQADREEGRELFEAVMETTMDGIAVLESIRDSSNAIIDFDIRLLNRRLAEITQRDTQDVLGRQLLEEFPGVQEEGLFDAYGNVAETGHPFNAEVRYQHEGMDASFRITALRMGDGVLLTLTDIADFKDREESLQADKRAAQRAALHDPLTGLPNRAYLAEHLEVLRAAGTGRYALVYIDLDHFKVLNDIQGHKAGDNALRAVAAAMESEIRNEDFVARVGGDEFVAVLRLELDSQLEAETLAQRLLREVRIVLPDPVGASGGVCIWHTIEQQPEEMLANADRAMYVNKRARQYSTRLAT